MDWENIPSPYFMQRQKKMDEERIVDGIFIGAYLTIIILRIFNVIAWGWEWILLPLWLPLVLAAVGLVIGLLIGIPMVLYRKIRGRIDERN